MTPQTGTPGTRWVLRLFWVVPLAFYGGTVCRGPGWIDSSMIATFANSLYLGTSANTHNLFHVLGRIWTLLLPFGDLHARLNLLCSVLGAATVYVIFLTGYRLTSNLAASLVGAVALMVSHSLWWHSTMLEVYTLNTALLAGMLCCLAAYDRTRGPAGLYGAVFLFGLACSNHILMGLFLFAFVAVAFWPRPLAGKTLAKLAVCFAAGFGLFELVFLIDFSQRCLQLQPLTYRGEWQAFLELFDSATGGTFKRSMFPTYLPAATRWDWRLNYLFTLLMNYPSAAFVLGGCGTLGLWHKRREFPRTFVFLLVGLGVQATWSSNYMVWDMFAFGLPVWVGFGLLVILGFDWLWNKGGRVRPALLAVIPTLVIGPVLYARIPGWAATPGFWSGYFSQLDYVSNLWDPARFLADPNKRHYDEVPRIADAVFRELPRGAHLYDSDGKGHYPLALYYQRALRVRRDIHHHLIFGPEITQQSAAAIAREISVSLERGDAVYISSPYWPERLVLDQLYLLLGSRTDPRALSVEQLERTFPRYELRRIPLIEGRPFFIYRFVPRLD